MRLLKLAARVAVGIAGAGLMVLVILLAVIAKYAAAEDAPKPERHLTVVPGAPPNPVTPTGCPGPDSPPDCPGSPPPTLARSTP